MCLVPLILGVCLADPAELTISADASRQTSGDMTYFSGARCYGGGTLGHIEIEMPVVLSKQWELKYGFEHTSLLDTRSDRGEERIYFGFAWKPFR